MNTLVIYLLISINLATFVLRGRDKRKSVKKGRRVSEATLLTFCLFGGIFGGIVGMKIFHHKTIKGPFQIRFFAICGLWIILAFLILYFG